MKLMRYGTFLFVAVFAFGCRSMPWLWSSQTSNRIYDELAAEQKAVPKTNELPPAVRDALLPGIKIDTSVDLAKSQQRFDLAVKNAPARDVFLSLVNGTSNSVVLEPGVRGTISLQLNNVTVDEAFEAIKNTYGFPYKKVKNRYTVYGKGFRSKIFKVNNLNLIRTGISSTNVRTGELSGRSSGTSSGSASSVASSSSNASVGVQTSSKSDFWTSLRNSLEGLIGNAGGRKVVVNAESNLVIVRATADELEIVEEFLNSSHDIASQQVILEAKIMEVELKDGYQAGINWARLMSGGGFSVGASQVGGGKILTGAGISDIGGSNTNSLMSSNIANAQTSAFGGLFSVAVNSMNFGAFIEMMQTQGDVQVLSSPRVSTVNSQKAVIKIGGEEFYVTGITQGAAVSNAATGGTAPSTPSIELTPFFSGISLDVTPQIEDTEHITLHLHSTVSEVNQSNKTFIISSDNYDLPLATSTIRESDSIVRAKSGQMIVVGGLMKETTSDYEAKIPILGSLPIIGNLFKQKKVSRVKKELVMLIKPTIVDSNQYWAQESGTVLERFDAIRP